MAEITAADARVVFCSPLTRSTSHRNFTVHDDNQQQRSRKHATDVKRPTRNLNATPATESAHRSPDDTLGVEQPSVDDKFVSTKTELFPRSLSADNVLVNSNQPKDHHRHLNIPGGHALAARLNRLMPQELMTERNADRRDSYIVEQDSLRTFLFETQWHGLKRMGMQTRFGFFVYWWVVVLVCYSLLAALIGVTIRDMISNPLRTTITTDEPYYQMPVYYLCDSNQVWLRKLQSSPYKLLQPVLEQYVMAMWTKTTTTEFESNFLDTLRNNATGKEIYALMNTTSFEDFVLQTRPDYKQIELICLYDRQSCKAAGIRSKDVWLLGRGWCRAYYFTRNCDYEDGINSLIAGRGCKRSLDLVIRLNSTDNWLGQTLTLIDEFNPTFQRYLTILTSFNRYSNASHVANGEVEIVDVNDDYEDVLPTYSSLYTDDENMLSAGTFKSVASAYHFYTGSAAGNCLADELAYQACLTKCYLASVEHLSNCRLFQTRLLSPPKTNTVSLGPCSIRDILSGMLLHIGRSAVKEGHVQSPADYYSPTSDGGPASYVDSARGNSHAVPRDSFSRRKNSVYFENCTCLRPCQRHYYHSQATEVRSPSDRGARLLQILIPELAAYKPELLKDSVSVLKLELKSLTREKVSVDSVMSIQNFFSNIGGQLGLFCGGSLISVFEAIEWFLRYIWVCCRRL